MVWQRDGAGDAAGGAGAAGPAALDVDWSARLRARLAGTRPRHEPEAWVVPGLSAADSGAYLRHLPAHTVPAAVLVPLVERAELMVLLTERATRLRHHAGQISFPGGRIEDTDADPRAAALREAREEIGLDPRFVSVIGYLPDHVVVTGYRVTPVVALVGPQFQLQLDRQEVADTFEVPVSYIFNSANHRLRRRRSGFTGEEGDFWDIPWRDRNIWGATAGMLLTLYRTLAADPA